eukprot:Hpha_TRINITY_DN14023_c0_g2::TRINITY_DN14023_c0_g2_i1::g.44250::m.44250
MSSGQLEFLVSFRFDMDPADARRSTAMPAEFSFATASARAAPGDMAFEFGGGPDQISQCSVAIARLARATSSGSVNQSGIEMYPCLPTNTGHNSVSEVSPLCTFVSATAADSAAASTP